MSSIGLPSVRAETIRRNGAKSRGPMSPEGKARSAQNALSARTPFRPVCDSRHLRPFWRGLSTLTEHAGGLRLTKDGARRSAGLRKDPNGRTPMTEAAWRMVTQKCNGWRRNATG